MKFSKSIGCFVLTSLCLTQLFAKKKASRFEYKVPERHHIRRPKNIVPPQYIAYHQNLNAVTDELLSQCTDIANKMFPDQPKERGIWIKKTISLILAAILIANPIEISLITPT